MMNFGNQLCGDATMQGTGKERIGNEASREYQPFLFWKTRTIELEVTRVEREILLSWK